MITFVIYTNRKRERKVCSEIIERFLFARNDSYDIQLYDENDLNTRMIKRTKGVKVFVLDIDMPRGLELAKKIRLDGDLFSPIILLTDVININLVERLNNVLYLKIIRKSIDNTHDILVALREAYKIVTKYAVLSFTHFDETYRLAYDDICHIDKDVCCNSVTIYSIDDTYQDYMSIKEMQFKLKDDVRFYKSHRSCIVNVYNIASYDRRNNLIVFKNGLTTNLVSRSKRKGLIKRLEEIDGSFLCEEMEEEKSNEKSSV